jgi:hypothetical protein
MKYALDAHLEGSLLREDLLTLLMWEMAAVEDKTVTNFIAEVQNQDPEGDLSYDVTRTYKYVRH